ncbi:MAG TPA: bifunctional riboflavin kinase/FAD synthetase [Spirochaetota bacterium]|nr:bifunctional riboflavin kinase/FAD synthetase [Spirochaetota bacterium]HQE57865.1 bifunctional riboflavin kinase/FAD synthetase [Spirochaetota bacterium]
MNVFYSIEEARGKFDRTVCAVGNFDGVHLGHTGIFQKMKEEAERRNAETLIITFKSHPRSSLYPSESIKMLSLEDEKINAILSCGIDNVLIMDFSRETSQMSPGYFINNILIPSFNVVAIIAGYDHALGKNREGNIDHIKNITHGKLEVIEVQPFSIGGHPVSSSKIRSFITDGEIESASKFLGRNYSMSGKIIKGFGRGRQIGFPTANLCIDDSKIIPLDGVYAVYAGYNGKTHKGVLNIGSNPTFGNQSRTIELHILKFSKDIYDEIISVHFVSRIRAEIKFSSVDALISQINDDIAKAVELLSEEN